MAKPIDPLESIEEWEQISAPAVVVAESIEPNEYNDPLAGIEVWGGEPVEEPAPIPAAPAEQQGGELLSLDALRGVTPEDPILNDAENWADTQSAIRSMPANSVEPDADIDQQDSSFLDEFMYFFRSGESDVTNAAAFLEAKYPLGQFKIGLDGVDYLSPDEAYGEGFMQASEDVRRVMIRDAKQREIEQDYPQFVGQEPDSGVANFLGTGAKILASPTTLFPVGQGYKGLLGMGAIMGAEYEALSQMRDTGSWIPEDMGEVGKSAAIGAGGSLVLGTALNQAAKRLSRVSAKRRNKAAVEKADKDFDDIYEVAVELQATKNIPPAELPQQISNRMGLPVEKVVETLETSSKIFVVPTKTEAKALVELSRANTVGQSKWFDRGLGIASSRIARFSEPLAQKFQRIEGRIKQASYRDTQLIKPTIDAINKQLPKQHVDTMQQMLFSGSFKPLRALLNKHTQIGSKALDDIVSLLESKRAEAIKAGLDIGKIENYFPRIVLDRDGLRTSKGLDAARIGDYNNALDNYAKRIGKKDRFGLTTDEEAVVLNNWHRPGGQGTGKSGKGVTESRIFSTVGRDDLKFYERYDNTLYSYLEDINRLIHTKNMLGSSVKQANGKVAIDVEDSIGLLLAEEKAAGRLAIDDVSHEELAQSMRLLLAPPKNIGQGIRYMQALTYGETITSVTSAATQLADLPHNLRSNGLYPTIKALLSPSSYNSKNVDRILGDMVKAELGTTASTLNFVEKALDTVLSSVFTVFKPMDKLTKGVFLNSSFEKAFALAKTDKGIKRLREDYGVLYGEDFYSLIQDLQNRVKSPLTEEFLFIKASEIYPTSRAETVESVLEHPWFRLGTMLKNYTLKSIYDGVVRRGIVNNVKKGRYEEAAYSALQLVTVFALAEAGVQEIKDFMLGRGFHKEDIVEQNFFDSLLRVAGVSRYVIDRYGSQGDVSQVLLQTLAPPFILLDSAVKDAIKAYDEELTFDNSKMVSSAPVIGRFVKAYKQVGEDGLTQSERMSKEQDKERREREIQRMMDARARVLGN
ncbi:hypothetical protein N9K75_00390 [bacterium]|nr:hypothetical protein [bacterium]MDB4352255.1 hypothetical protein [Porticoccaceae bacterium]